MNAPGAAKQSGLVELDTIGRLIGGKYCVHGIYIYIYIYVCIYIYIYPTRGVEVALHEIHVL